MTIFDENLVLMHQSFKDQDYAVCEKYCDLILSVQSSNPEALYCKGRVSEILNHPEEAISCYSKLALLFPHEKEYLRLLEKVASESQVNVRDVKERVEQARLQIESFPGRPSLQFFDNSIGKGFVPAHPSNDQIAQKMITGQVFDSAIVDIAKQYISPGSSVIDAGANLGQMTMIFSSLTGSSGVVYSIEADDYLTHVTQESLKINNIHNVVQVCHAVHEFDDKALYFPVQDFKTYHCYGAYGIDPHSQSGRQVKTKTIDSLNISVPVSFMKVDVQGSDLFAMRGAVRTIQKYRFPIIFEYEEDLQETFSTTFQDYVDFVSSIKYRFLKTIDRINYLIVPQEH